MVEHFTDLASVKSEMRVSKMNESNACHKDQHPWIISLTLRFKRIIA